MILHTINKSPFSNNTLLECLRLCSDGDAIIFIEDGVYAIQQQTDIQQILANHPAIKLYALEPDIKARGLESQIGNNISCVDDIGFVELTVQYQRVQSWY